MDEFAHDKSPAGPLPPHGLPTPLSSANTDRGSREPALTEMSHLANSNHLAALNLDELEALLGAPEFPQALQSTILCCCLTNDGPLLQSLLSRADFQPFLDMNPGNVDANPLACAAVLGHDNIIRVLCGAGARPLARVSGGWDAGLWAAVSVQGSALRALQGAGWTLAADAADDHGRPFAQIIGNNCPLTPAGQRVLASLKLIPPPPIWVSKDFMELGAPNQAGVYVKALEFLAEPRPIKHPTPEAKTDSEAEPELPSDAGESAANKTDNRGSEAAPLDRILVFPPTLEGLETYLKVILSQYLPPFCTEPNLQRRPFQDGTSYKERTPAERTSRAELRSFLKMSPAETRKPTTMLKGPQSNEDRLEELERGVSVPASATYFMLRWANFYWSDEAPDAVLSATLKMIDSHVQAGHLTPLLLVYRFQCLMSLLHFLRQDSVLFPATLMGQATISESLTLHMYEIVKALGTPKAIEQGLLDYDPSLEGLTEQDRLNEVRAQALGTLLPVTDGLTAKDLLYGALRRGIRRTSSTVRKYLSAPVQAITPQSITESWSLFLGAALRCGVPLHLVEWVITGLLEWIKAVLCNRLMGLKDGSANDASDWTGWQPGDGGYSNRQKAVQIRLNVTVLEDWVRRHAKHFSANPNPEAVTALTERLLAPLSTVAQLCQLCQVLTFLTTLEAFLELLQQIPAIPLPWIHQVMDMYEYGEGDLELSQEIYAYVAMVCSSKTRHPAPRKSTAPEAPEKLEKSLMEPLSENLKGICGIPRLPNALEVGQSLTHAGWQACLGGPPQTFPAAPRANVPWVSARMLASLPI